MTIHMIIQLNVGLIITFSITKTDERRQLYIQHPDASSSYISCHLKDKLTITSLS